MKIMKITLRHRIAYTTTSSTIPLLNGNGNGKLNYMPVAKRNFHSHSHRSHSRIFSSIMGLLWWYSILFNACYCFAMFCYINSTKRPHLIPMIKHWSIYGFYGVRRGLWIYSGSFVRSLYRSYAMPYYYYYYYIYEFISLLSPSLSL